MFVAGTNFTLNYTIDKDSGYAVVVSTNLDIRVTTPAGVQTYYEGGVTVSQTLVAGTTDGLASFTQTSPVEGLYKFELFVAADGATSGTVINTTLINVVAESTTQAVQVS